MIDEAIRPLAQAPQQAYLSNRMQVADILQWILEQTGPATVRMTSFSISEEFLRRLFFIRQQGLVKDIDIILDFKATNKTLILWPFIAQTVRNCYLSANHSKVLLLENDNATVSVVMSQNLTRGNRYESGFISTSAEVFRTLRDQFEYVKTRQSVPFHEVFDRTVNQN